jgi:two-component system NtrC family sensor kinase
MLRTKLLQAFAVLVLLIGTLSAFIGIRIINMRVLNEAESQLTQNLSGARAILNAQIAKMADILKLISLKKIVVDTAFELSPEKEHVQDLQNRLIQISRIFELDFLSIVLPDGKVLVRAFPPFNSGDYVLYDPAVTKALAGEAAVGFQVYSRQQLERENEVLPEKAFLSIEETPHARLTQKKEESRGLVMMAAYPIVRGSQVMGAVYGGILLNRNLKLVDMMNNTTFRDELYKGKPLGTTTLFLDDVRIATTVKFPNGNRALGTRVSKEVADRVLDNGDSWLDRAFVVNEWYISAYEPIRDICGKIVGILYVGILEKPFVDLRHSIVMRYAGLMLFGLVLAMVLSFIYAARLANPIHQLVQAARRMERGELSSVSAPSSCKETEELVAAFNRMAMALSEREKKLRDTNESLQQLNRNYMETLGFVSHELKGPAATMMNYVYLLKEQKLGALSEKQIKILGNIDFTLRHMVEMIRHYLNLSRIEKNELSPALTKIDVYEEIIQPLLDSYKMDFDLRKMVVETNVAHNLQVRADINLTREIFENLISNALKYGKDGGRVVLSAKENGAFVQFSVWNEGMGIKPEEKEKMFGKFSRLSTDRMNVYAQKGTGLGLFITRNIIQSHGGAIEVDSKFGEWIEFKFTLPLYKDKSQ